MRIYQQNFNQFVRCSIINYNIITHNDIPPAKKDGHDKNNGTEYILNISDPLVYIKGP